MENSTLVPKRILESLMSSLSAGVVPRLGAPYVAIGREDEVNALLRDLSAVSEGGSSMRFIIGRYGSGKSFLMQLMRGYALERGYVTCDCDLSPERRFSGGHGSGLATYRELVRNMATKTSADGGALPVIISKWLSSLQSETAAEGNDPSSPGFAGLVDKKVYTVLSELEGSVGGFDFAHVLSEYYRAVTTDGDALRSDCLRWLRGEYTTRTEARKDIGAGSVIDDDNWYDYIKLWAQFVRLCSYNGLIVFIDECVNLYKITNRIGRENNYEKILSMFNDTLQGRAKGLAIILGGTPKFLEDTRRGLFSYEALRSRLADSRFVSSGSFTDLLGPVIRLKKLSANETLALIARVTKLHRQYYGWEPRVTEEDMVSFYNEISARIGADVRITPREIIRDYLSVLNILLQNPEVNFSQVIGTAVSGGACAAAAETDRPDDGLTLEDIEI